MHVTHHCHLDFSCREAEIPGSYKICGSGGWKGTSKSRLLCAFLMPPWLSNCRSRGDAFLNFLGLLMWDIIFSNAAST